jgi:hypothetical protein
MDLKIKCPNPQLNLGLNNIKCNVFKNKINPLQVLASDGPHRNMTNLFTYLLLKNIFEILAYYPLQNNTRI